MCDTVRRRFSLVGFIAVCGLLLAAFWGGSQLAKEQAKTDWGVQEQKLLMRFEREKRDLEAAHAQTVKSMEEKHAQVVNGLETEHARVVGDLRELLAHCQIPPPVPPVADVLDSGHFGKGLFTGLNTSEGRTDWATRLDDCIRLDYPGAKSWGTWFVTVGRATDDKRQRRCMDFSAYSKLLLELKGKKGAFVTISLKDLGEYEGGEESRHSFQLRSDGWEAYEVGLETFKRADLKQLHVVPGFVFGSAPQTVFVRKIQFR